MNNGKPTFAPPCTPIIWSMIKVGASSSGVSLKRVQLVQPGFSLRINEVILSVFCSNCNLICLPPPHWLNCWSYFLLFPKGWLPSAHSLLYSITHCNNPLQNHPCPLCSFSPALATHCLPTCSFWPPGSLKKSFCCLANDADPSLYWWWPYQGAVFWLLLCLHHLGDRTLSVWVGRRRDQPSSQLWATPFTWNLEHLCSA